MKRLILSIILVLAGLSALSAQEYVAPEVEISQEKVNIDGNIYWAHKVIKKQTLYSICKKYNVVIDSVYKANPILVDGLKEGSIIFIPQNAVKDLVNQVVTVINNNSDNIKESNSETLVEPQDVVVEEKVAVVVADSSLYRKHTVKWYETLHLIAKKYDVEKEDIILLNNLKDGKVKRKSTILIPNKYEDIKSVIEEKSEEVLISENKEREDSLKSIDYPELTFSSLIDRMKHLLGIDHYSKDNPAKIALLLPLNASFSNAGTTSYMDFYAGFLLAINSLKEKNINLDLSVYDIANDKLEAIIDANSLKNMDLVIAPIPYKSAIKVANYCDINSIPLVLTLDKRSNVLAEKGINTIQFSVDEENQYENLVNSINKGITDQVTLIYEKSTYNNHIFKTIDSLMSSNNIAYNTLSYDILEGRTVGNKLMAKLNKSRTNKVIVASDNEAFVMDALRNLNILHSREEYDIQVYGLSKWHSYETMEFDYYHALNLHISMPFYIDYNKEEVKDFVKQYRALYNTEPNQMAFHGYDVAYYFTSTICKLGPDFMQYITHYPQSLLQSEVKFERIENGGLRNIATREIEHIDGYTIRVLDDNHSFSELFK